MVNTPEKIVYTASATSTGGRDGRSTSTDPDMDFGIASPPAMGGDGKGTNPEQLFAMGYGACFNGALGLAAKETGLDVDGSQVRVNVGFGPEGESFAVTADIEVFVPGADVAQVQKAADRAHELCPYSKATRGNVPVTVKAVDAL